MNLDRLVKRVYVSVLRGSYKEAMDLVFKNNHLLLDFNQIWELKRLIEDDILKGISNHEQLSVDDIPIYYDQLMFLRTMVTVFDRYEYVLNYKYDLNDYITDDDIGILEDETELLFSVIKDKYVMTDKQEEHVRNQIYVALAELKVTESD